MTQLSREDLIKHWLLNTAIEFHRPLLHILPKSRGLTLNAPDVPGCKPQDYADGLESLFHFGYVTFSSEDPRDDVNSRAGVQAILKRFLSYRIEPPEERYAREKRRVDPLGPRIARVEFALTESGGALWEKVAKPNWSKFVDDGVVFGEHGFESGDATSPDMNLLMATLGWLPELHNAAIHIDSLHIKERFDDFALYWKRLPRLYTAGFKCSSSEARWERQGRSNYPLEPDWFRQWRSSTSRFYTHPWELPEWPRA